MSPSVEHLQTALREGCVVMSYVFAVISYTADNPSPLWVSIAVYAVLLFLYVMLSPLIRNAYFNIVMQLLFLATMLTSMVCFIATSSGSDDIDYLGISTVFLGFDVVKSSDAEVEKIERDAQE